MFIKIKFEIGQTVYSVTDPDQHARMVTGFTVRKSVIYYLVTFIDHERQFEEFELSNDKIFR